MSPTQLLTLTFSRWMSQLSVNYRATWRPPPHDRKSIKTRKRGRAALFHFFCPERGLQKVKICSQEMKTMWNHEKEWNVQYFEEEVQLRTTLQHFFSPPQYPVGQKVLFLVGPELLEGHIRISRKEKKSPCSHTHWCIKGCNLLYFIFVPMFFKVFLIVVGKGSPARHECIAFNPLGLVVVPFSHHLICDPRNYSSVVFHSDFSQSFSICGIPGYCPGEIQIYMPICINPHLCVRQTGLRT